MKIQTGSSPKIANDNFAQRIGAVRDCKAEILLRNAQIINVLTSEIYLGDVAIYQGIITGVGKKLPVQKTEDCQEFDLEGAYLSPGLIDAHVHIESSMSVPAGFASVVLPCGTTTVIADPHEIANVCGNDGIAYFLEQARNLPLHIHTMMPSCVPCSPFENNGRRLDARHMAELMEEDGVLGLGEVMNPTAVVQTESGMMDKLMLFQNKAIDGHAPLLEGQDLAAYHAAGIQTDHECSTYQEIVERLRIGMKVMLRVGSAANDMEEILTEIASSHLSTRNMMFCTDDKHVEDIRKEGHINHILKMAVSVGIPPIEAIQMATINPATHYRLKDTGAIAPGYQADLVAFEDLKAFKPRLVVAGGKLIGKNPTFDFVPAPSSVRQTVHNREVLKEQLAIHIPQGRISYPVMELRPHQLLTKLIFQPVKDLPLDKNGNFLPSGEFAKIAVVERHHATGNVGIGILQGFGIHGGAIASTVAHDSHNIVVVGDNDEDILAAIAGLKPIGGGYTIAMNGRVAASLSLPIAGLLSEAPAIQTQDTQKKLIHLAYSLGIHTYYDPFLSLSFLALPVIPEVRITDMGMFDVCNQKFLL